jgi:hypothetical protein
LALSGHRNILPVRLCKNPGWVPSRDSCAEISHSTSYVAPYGIPPNRARSNPTVAYQVIDSSAIRFRSPRPVSYPLFRRCQAWRPQVSIHRNRLPVRGPGSSSSVRLRRRQLFLRSGHLKGSRIRPGRPCHCDAEHRDCPSVTPLVMVRPVTRTLNMTPKNDPAGDCRSCHRRRPTFETRSERRPCGANSRRGCVRKGVPPASRLRTDEPADLG